MWRGRLNSRNLNRINLLRVAVIVLFLYLAERGITAIFREWAWITVNSVGGQYWAIILKSIGPELGGIVIGVVIIDWLNERRQEEQLKRQLIMQLRSKYPDIADISLSTLKSFGWGFGNDKTLQGAVLVGANLGGTDLTGVNLKGAVLMKANLSGADLRLANLEGTYLNEANLKEAVLVGAPHLNLKGAVLDGANLEKANLFGAKLTRAILHDANLKGAYMVKANLEKAYLFRANLEEANLENVNLKGAERLTNVQLKTARSIMGAIMPDGTQLYTEGDNHTEPCLGCPTLEEWLEKQGQISPEERAISFDDEKSNKLVEQEQSELTGSDIAAITEDQVENIRDLVKNSVGRNQNDIIKVYLKLTQKFKVRWFSELTQDQYPAVVEFLEQIKNQSVSTEN